MASLFITTIYSWCMQSHLQSMNVFPYEVPFFNGTFDFEVEVAAWEGAGADLSSATSAWNSDDKYKQLHSSTNTAFTMSCYWAFSTGYACVLCDYLNNFLIIFLLLTNFSPKQKCEIQIFKTHDSVPLKRSLLKGGCGLSLQEDTMRERTSSTRMLISQQGDTRMWDVPLVCGGALQRSPPGFLQHRQRRTHPSQTDQWGCRDK